MTPGPTIIRKCSACGKYIAQHTIRSGNTFGARFWTDGKCDAPMLPDQPWLVKCSHCSAIVWIDEQKEVGKIEPWGPRSRTADEFKDARPASTPDLHDYIGCLTAGVSDKQKEKYLRLRAWWASNDIRRDSDRATPLTEIETANLRAFLSLLDEKSDNDRIMKAEVLRELGLFEDAESLLATQFEEGLMQAVGIIRSLNQQRSTAVEEMKFK